MTLMTQAAFATRRGVGKPAVSNWKKAGLLVFAEGEGGKLFVDVERSEARLNARLDPMRGRPATAAPIEVPELPIEDDAAPIAPVKGGVHGARAELIIEQLIGQRQKNARDAGELVPRAEMDRRASELGRLVRERGKSELRSVAERLAATADVRQVMAILDEAHDRFCNALADAIDSGAIDQDDEAYAEPVDEAA